MMDAAYKCSKIHVNINNLYSIPKTGECIFKVNDNYGTVTLKLLKSKQYFSNEPYEEEVITHQVCFLYPFFVLNI